MDEADKRRMLSDAIDFFQSESWYAKRGIPWRRGYMLAGSPGSGKSSTISALASELDLPVYTIPLSSQEMSDQGFADAMRSVPARNIVILEDIDVATAHAKRQLEATASSKTSTLSFFDEAPVAAPGHSAAPTSGLSLSAVLNGIDGCDGAEGRIVVMTRDEDEGSGTHTARQDPQATQAGSVKSPQLAKIARLASQWSHSVDDYEFSLAALQGMLSLHKHDAMAAVKQMHEWTANARAEGRDKAFASDQFSDAPNLGVRRWL